MNIKDKSKPKNIKPKKKKFVKKNIRNEDNNCDFIDA